MLKILVITKAMPDDSPSVNGSFVLRIDALIVKK